MLKTLLASLALLGLATTSLSAQTTPPAHTVFLLGNTAQGELSIARLQALHQAKY